MKTVVFDFDGVIHSYTSGWKGNIHIPDPPVPGIREAIAEIRDAGYRVVVVSARNYTSDGMAAVRRYLAEHDIVVDAVLQKKPPAVAYVDDRAICFDGNAGGLLEEIESFVPWMHKPAVEQVNHPAHYNAPGRKECIDEMVDIWGAEYTAVWCEMTAYKYEYRAGAKEGNSAEQDLAKRDWYLQKARSLRAEACDNAAGAANGTEGAFFPAPYPRAASAAPCNVVEELEIRLG